MYDIEKIYDILADDSKVEKINSLDTLEEFKDYLVENGIDISLDEAQDLVDDLADADLDEVVGGRGPQGSGRPQPGRPGQPQRPGQDKQPGQPGQPGKPGQNGYPQKQPGQPGKPGQPGGPQGGRGGLNNKFSGWGRR